MIKTLPALCLIAVFSSGVAFSDTCVKVRDGNEGYQCMEFSHAEKALALKYGLYLGMPHKAVRRLLTENGWGIDQEWLKESDAELKGKNQPLCGSGWDAICSISYAKGKSRIEIYLSGTNEGIPLIGINEQP
jgi:hypothetical protein